MHPGAWFTVNLTRERPGEDEKLATPTALLCKAALDADEDASS